MFSEHQGALKFLARLKFVPLVPDWAAFCKIIELKDEMCSYRTLRCSLVNNLGQD